MSSRTDKRANGQRRIYLAEMNRALHDNIRCAAEFLEHHGITVTRIAHLTALLLERPPTMSWDEFKHAVHSALQPRIGSAVLSSCATGRVFLCSQPGQPARPIPADRPRPI